MKHVNLYLPYSRVYRQWHAWDTLQDSTDDSSSDKVEASLEQQEHFPQFKIRLMLSLVTFIFPYAFESRTLTAEPQRRIHATEIKCCRNIQRISYKDHATNEEVRTKIQQPIEPHEDLLTIVKRGILQWYGHVSRSSGLDKTILQGTVKGGRRQGRQKKRWEDNRGMDRPGVRQVSEGSVEQGKMEETGCEIISGAPVTLAVQG